MNIAKQTGVAIREYDKRIAELEQQLADMKEENTRFIKANIDVANINAGLQAELTELREAVRALVKHIKRGKPIPLETLLHLAHKLEALEQTP